MIATDQVLVYDVDPGRATAIVALLEKADPTRVGAIRTFSDLVSRNYGPSPGIQAIQGGQAALVVVVEHQAFSAVADSAKQSGVPTLLVVERLDEPAALSEKVKSFDAWMTLETLEPELAARVAGLLARRGKGATPLPPIDSRFLALVIHDLRTPLNVIGLTIRAITQTVPQRTAELDEDLTFLTDNARQIERMLTQLGDYCRLIEGETPPTAAEFDPRRFLDDFLEERRSKSGFDPTPVRLEAGEGPAEVALDPFRVRLALQNALGNAMNAAGGSPVRVSSTGTNGRWVVEMVVEKPPPATVASMELRPDRFERLAGSPAERRGLDLAIVARVSETFGGSARLEVEAGRRSTIVMDWPERLPGA